MPDEQRTPNLLGALALAVNQRMFDAMAAAADLTPSDQAALTFMAQYPGTSVAQLAQVLALAPSSTTRLVDRLATKGWLRRRGSAQDGRQTTLELSAAGQRKAQALMARRMAALAQIVALLDAQDQAHLARLMERLLAGLTPDRLSADRICRLCDERVCPLASCPVECAVAQPA